MSPAEVAQEIAPKQLIRLGVVASRVAREVETRDPLLVRRDTGIFQHLAKKPIREGDERLRRNVAFPLDHLKCVVGLVCSYDVPHSHGCQVPLSALSSDELLEVSKEPATLGSQ